MISQQKDRLYPSSLVTLGILAGGSAQRWGGRDKGAVVMGGELLVGRLTNTWAPCYTEVLINTHRNARLYDHYADRLVCDRQRRQGPCFGAYALLEACKTPLLLLAPVDLTDIPPDLPVGLYRQLGVQCAGNVAVNQNGQHSLVMMLRRELLTPLGAFLDAGGRSVTGMIQHCGVEAIVWPQPIRDADQPADLNQKSR